jgi:hypothetical protein
MIPQADPERMRITYVQHFQTAKVELTGNEDNKVGERDVRDIRLATEHSDVPSSPFTAFSFAAFGGIVTRQSAIGDDCGVVISAMSCFWMAT